MDNSKNPLLSGAERQTHIGAAEAYIALGSNVGDRNRLLREALLLIDSHSAINVIRVSGIYETDPVGYTEQPAFLNMTAALLTTLAPIELLHALLDIEKQLGRTRDIRWGPRTMDLDLAAEKMYSLMRRSLRFPIPV